MAFLISTIRLYPLSKVHRVPRLVKGSGTKIHELVYLFLFSLLFHLLLISLFLTPGETLS